MNIFDIEYIAFDLWGYKASYVELIAALFGLVSVYLASRANILTWPTGIINELFLFLLFFQVQLYADVFLQVYFFIMTLYGWYNWKTNTRERSISSLNVHSRTVVAITTIAGSTIAGFFFSNIHTYLPAYFKTPAAYPFADSFVMVCSIIATVLLARKKVENWWLWIAADIVCIVLYYVKGIYFLSLEYAIFLLLASYGLYRWQQQLKHD